MDWNELKAHLEPVSKNFYTNMETDVQLSQAISLKRIADALEKLTKVPTMPEITPEQEAEMMTAAKNAGFIIEK